MSLMTCLCLHVCCLLLSHINVQSLKADYQSKMEENCAEMDRLKSERQGELTKLQMAKRKAELSVTSLQQQLAQKVRVSVLRLVGTHGFWGLAQ